VGCTDCPNCPSTVTKPSVNRGVEEKAKLTPLYRVLLHNDDVNTMDHVASSLMEVFSIDQNEAITIMLEAHESGVALCRVEPMEHAEFHQERLQSLSLTATIEPEN
jgi:ATP-dependent Clp protease adaptor protein ClpS